MHTVICDMSTIPNSRSGLLSLMSFLHLAMIGSSAKRVVASTPLNFICIISACASPFTFL
jgi:hypothetical protein